MRYLLLSLFAVVFSYESQALPQPTINFIGIMPSVTVEPFYDKGDFDVNVFPFVFQKTLNSRFDFRLTSICNLGFRNTRSEVSHIGGTIAFPYSFYKKNVLTNPTQGSYIAPGIGITRNGIEKHTNIGVWLEPGYHLLVSKSYSVFFGFQMGVTHFSYDNGKSMWGNHYGFKIVVGRWFNCLKKESLKS